METRGLGAGSYPNPPEPQEKIFRFNFAGSFYGNAIVRAKNEEEAYRLIEEQEFEEEELDITEITDIEDVEEI